MGGPVGAIPQMQAPGNYPGAGQAKLLNANHQYYAWQNQRVTNGTASQAFQLERQKSAFYPQGWAVEVSFSADPGVFEVDIQGAEIDQDSSYAQLGSGISGTNASFTGRFDVLTYYPKFIRLYMKTLTNDVRTTAVVTR